MDRRDLVAQMLSDLESPKRTLASHELEFIEGISDMFWEGGELTDPQYNWLCRIHEEKV